MPLVHLARFVRDDVRIQKGRRHMRNTFFDVDQDSTIVSMLTVRDSMQPAKSPLTYKVLAGSAAVILLILYLSGGAPWQ